jgi:hypothetical protein
MNFYFALFFLLLYANPLLAQNSVETDNFYQFSVFALYPMLIAFVYMMIEIYLLKYVLNFREIGITGSQAKKAEKASKNLKISILLLSFLLFYCILIFYAGISSLLIYQLIQYFYTDLDFIWQFVMFIIFSFPVYLKYRPDLRAWILDTGFRIRAMGPKK